MNTPDSRPEDLLPDNGPTLDDPVNAYSGKKEYAVSRAAVFVQAAVAAAVIFALYLTWEQRREKTLGESQYRAGKQHIVIQDPPPWISPRFIDEVLKDAPDLAGEINITDRGQVERFYRALTHHPWVKRVKSLKISYPANIVASIEFREPIALVEASDHYEGEYENSVFPIDCEGTLLPDDYLTASMALDPSSVYDYIWIAGIQSTPMGGTGEPWNDPAVEDAAMLADFLSDKFVRLGIQKISLPPNQQLNELEADARFELITTHNRKIPWGVFPASPVISARKQADGQQRSETLKSELFAREQRKVDWLVDLIQRYGSLDDVPQEELDKGMGE